MDLKVRCSLNCFRHLVIYENKSIIDLRAIMDHEKLLVFQCFRCNDTIILQFFADFFFHAIGPNLGLLYTQVDSGDICMVLMQVLLLTDGHHTLIQDFFANSAVTCHQFQGQGVGNFILLLPLIDNISWNHQPFISYHHRKQDSGQINQTDSRGQGR